MPRAASSQFKTADSSPLLAALFTTTRFDELNVGLSVWSEHGARGLCGPKDNVLIFEIEHRNELPRWEYNGRCLERAWREQRPILGHHSGFHDLFVPVPNRKSLALVSGPFARAWPTSADVAERWRGVAHSRESLSDPSFSRYLAATLATLTLDGPLYDLFESLVVGLARLLGGEGDPVQLNEEQDRLKDQLLLARKPERTWETARNMLDDRTAGQWSTAIARAPLAELGLKRPPRHAVVGLLRPLSESVDPIDDALRRHAFQRAVTHAALEQELVCGQIGDHGVVLLAAFAAQGARARTGLTEVVRRTAETARRFGFKFHAGIAQEVGAEPLPARYRAALAAADTALFRDVALVFASEKPDSSLRSLGELRAALAESVSDAPQVFVSRFERYVEAVVVHAGYQLDATRAHLEAGLDRLVEPLLASGQLDPKNYGQIVRPLVNLERTTNTITLIDAYRAVVGEIERTLKQPTATRRTRSLKRALVFMREHLGETLALPRVARVAGFAPDHFSRLLREDEGLSFEPLLLRMRLERARHLLTTTVLHVGRISELTGFKSRPHFQQAFKRHARATPAEYRERTRER